MLAAGSAGTSRPAVQVSVFLPRKAIDDGDLEQLLKLPCNRLGLQMGSDANACIRRAGAYPPASCCSGASPGSQPAGACMQALGLFQRAVEEGHFKQQRWDTAGPWPARAEVNLHAMTAGVAVLSLFSWLLSLKQRLLARGPTSLPARLAIVSDKGKSSKEAGNLVVKEAVAAMMAQWESPFQCAPCPLCSLPSIRPRTPARACGLSSGGAGLWTA